MLSHKPEVLIVDDSVIVRKILSDIFAADPGIEVVGTAPDPYAARDLILSLKPDVITLDIEMPKMDGLTFLKLIMKHHPLPVIILSSLSQRGSHVALEALAAGAVDVMGKPSSSMVTKDMGPDLIAKVKAASGATRFSGSISAAAYYDPRHIILIGAYTGGTEALKEVLALLPANLPPRFAERLQRTSTMFRHARFARRARETFSGAAWLWSPPGTSTWFSEKAASPATASL